MTFSEWNSIFQLFHKLTCTDFSQFNETYNIKIYNMYFFFFSQHQFVIRALIFIISQDHHFRSRSVWISFICKKTFKVNSINNVVFNMLIEFVKKGVIIILFYPFERIIIPSLWCNACISGTMDLDRCMRVFVKHTFL
jgi:hypothetical protein